MKTLERRIRREFTDASAAIHHILPRDQERPPVIYGKHFIDVSSGERDTKFLLTVPVMRIRQEDFERRFLGVLEFLTTDGY